MAEIRLSSDQAARQWRDLSKKLRAAKATDLRKNLRKTIAEAGKPVLADVQDAVRSLPISSSHGGGQGQRRAHNVTRVRSDRSKERAARRGGGLRSTVASATKLQITAKGVRFIVDSKRLPVSQRNLPKRLDAERGWRHPVFGNREVWVAQHGGPWFGATIKQKAPAFRAAVVKGMEETRQALEKQ